MDPLSQKAKEIFLSLIEGIPEGEWQKRADEACQGDEMLRQRVRALLSAHAEPDSRLEEPALELPLTVEKSIAITEKPGVTIDRYKLLEQIGEGGFGIVFMAEQEEPVRRKVALKIIKPGMDTKEVIARFEGERQALALMDHPNIAKVLDAGATESGRPYFVMELVRGIPITEYCDQNNFSARKRLELFGSVCQAVQHAHQKGIIHRDIKPTNVMVTLRDDTPVTKVIDFGVAKATNARLTEKTLFTRFAQMVGTPLYMSPEQAGMSELDVDTRSDIYSLGVLLYELLTGTTPFDQKRIREAAYEELLKIIREEEPPKPSTRVSTLGEMASTVSVDRGTDPRRLSQFLRGDLDWIVMKALEKDRSRRYETATELAADVRRHLNHEAVVAGPPSVTYKLRKFVQRHKFGVLAWSMIAATAILGCALSTVGFVQARKARRVAEVQATRSQAIADFLRDDLLGSADPWTGRIEGTSVISFLDAASRQLEGKFADDRFVEASIRFAFGRTYWHLGRYKEAEEHLKRCLEIRRGQQLGDEDSETLLCMRELGRVCLSLGKSKQAEPLLVEAIEGMRRTLHEDDPNLLYCMGWLSWLYLDQGRYEEAEWLQREALDVIQRELGAEHPSAPSFIYSIGAIYQAQQRFDEAEKLITEALDISRRTRGDLGIETLNIVTQLGSLYSEQERYQDAEQLMTEALTGRRKVLGEEHPDTFSTMGSLGRLYRKQGEFDLAEQLLAECYQKSRESLGEEHPSTLQSRVNLSLLYYSQGKIDEAEALWAKTIEIVRQVLGDENPITLGAMHDVGMWYLNVGRDADAETLLVKALEGRRRTLGEEHPDTRASMGMLHFKRGQDYRAEPLLVQALENDRRTEGRELPQLMSLYYLALLHHRQGSYDKAEPLLVEFLEISQRGLIEGHPDTVAAIRELIRLYEAWGKPQQAEQWHSKLTRTKGTEEP